MKQVRFTKLLIKVMQRRGGQPGPAKTERLLKPQLESSQSSRFLSDPKLLRLYEAIDLSG